MSEQTVGRNAPCPCGSGRKFKRCCIDKKPITRSVLLDFGKQVDISAVMIEPSGRVIALHEEKEIQPVSAWNMFSRKRSKGEKVLGQVPVNPISAHIDIAKSMLNYDVIIAIDTNTKVINGEKVSISVYAQCRIRPEGDIAFFDMAFLGIFIFYNASVKEENFAWYLLQRRIQASPDYLASTRFAIISDSDFGKHVDYNNGTAPYVMEEYLPTNFKLVYMSEEGRDPINKILRICHNEANTGLQHIPQGGLGSNAPNVTTDLPCSRLQIASNGNTEFLRQGWFRLGIFPV